MPTFFIVNPRAGRDVIGRTFAPGAAWALTDGPGHAADLAEGAARAGFDIVAACGGDGTVHEALNGLMRIPQERRPALGIVPLGTANDLARSLGLPLRADAALDVLRGAETRPMDVGVAEGAFGERYFGVSAFAGAAAVIAERANSAGKPLPGLAGYLPWLPGLLRYRADVTVTADGVAWRGRALSVQAANGATGGGGLPIHPGARVDDGLLDVMVIRASPLPRTLGLLARIPFGRHTRLDAVWRRAAREVSMDGDGVPLALDGEVVGTLPARVRVLPGAVRVVTGRVV